MESDSETLTNTSESSPISSYRSARSNPASETSPTSDTCDLELLTDIPSLSDEETWLCPPEGGHEPASVKDWLNEIHEENANQTKQVNSRTFTRPKKKNSRPGLMDQIKDDWEVKTCANVDSGVNGDMDMSLARIKRINCEIQERLRTFDCEEMGGNVQVTNGFQNEPVGLLANGSSLSMSTYVQNLCGESFIQNMTPPSLINSFMSTRSAMGESDVFSQRFISNEEFNAATMNSLTDSDFITGMQQPNDLYASFTSQMSDYDGDANQTICNNSTFGNNVRELRDTFAKEMNLLDNDENTDENADVNGTFVCENNVETHLNKTMAIDHNDDRNKYATYNKHANVDLQMKLRTFFTPKNDDVCSKSYIVDKNTNNNSTYSKYADDINADFDVQMKENQDILNAKLDDQRNNLNNLNTSINAEMTNSYREKLLDRRDNMKLIDDTPPFRKARSVKELKQRQRQMRDEQNERNENRTFAWNEKQCGNEAGKINVEEKRLRNKTQTIRYHDNEADMALKDVNYQNETYVRPEANDAHLNQEAYQTYIAHEARMGDVSSNRTTDVLHQRVQNESGKYQTFVAHNGVCDSDKTYTQRACSDNQPEINTYFHNNATGAALDSGPESILYNNLNHNDQDNKLSSLKNVETRCMSSDDLDKVTADNLTSEKLTKFKTANQNEAEQVKSNDELNVNNVDKNDDTYDVNVAAAGKRVRSRMSDMFWKSAENLLGNEVQISSTPVKSVKHNRESFDLSPIDNNVTQVCAKIDDDVLKHAPIEAPMFKMPISRLPAPKLRVSKLQLAKSSLPRPVSAIGIPRPVSATVTRKIPGPLRSSSNLTSARK